MSGILLGALVSCPTLVDTRHERRVAPVTFITPPPPPLSPRGPIHTDSICSSARVLSLTKTTRGNRVCLKKKTLPEAQRTQGIDSITWVNLSARILQNWFRQYYLNCLQVWPPDGAPNILLQIWPLGRGTCISHKLGHDVTPNTSLTKRHHLH